MDQMIVTLEPGADRSLLKRAIKNMKGVGNVILKKETKPSAIKRGKSDSRTNAETEEWIRKMKDLSNSFNSDLIDMRDERTRYILSK